MFSQSYSIFVLRYFISYIHSDLRDTRRLALFQYFQFSMYQQSPHQMKKFQLRLNFTLIHKVMIYIPLGQNQQYKFLNMDLTKVLLISSSLLKLGSFYKQMILLFIFEYNTNQIIIYLPTVKTIYKIIIEHYYRAPIAIQVEKVLLIFQSQHHYKQEIINDQISINIFKLILRNHGAKQQNRINVLMVVLIQQMDFFHPNIFSLYQYPQF